MGGALLLSFQASSHHGVDTDPAVEGGCRQQGWVPGAPLHVKAPLVGCGQLINDLGGEMAVVPQG